MMMISYIYKKRQELKKAVRFEAEAFKNFYRGYFDDEDQDNLFTAGFLMKCTSCNPFKYYEKANLIYEKLLGRSSPLFLESLKKIADWKISKYQYTNNIELYRIDTRSFSKIPDISLTANNNTYYIPESAYEEAGAFYSFIEEQLEGYALSVPYSFQYHKHIKIIILSAYIQIYIMRNGKKSRQKIVGLAKKVLKLAEELYGGDESLFWLNAYCGLVCAYVRNTDVQKAEFYSVKMIEILEKEI